MVQPQNMNQKCTFCPSLKNRSQPVLHSRMFSALCDSVFPYQVQVQGPSVLKGPFVGPFVQGLAVLKLSTVSDKVLCKVCFSKPVLSHVSGWQRSGKEEHTVVPILTTRASVTTGEASSDNRFPQILTEVAHEYRADSELKQNYFLTINDSHSLSSLPNSTCTPEVSSQAFLANSSLIFFR